MPEAWEALLTMLPRPSNDLQALVMAMGSLIVALSLHWGLKRLRYRLRRWHLQKVEGRSRYVPAYLSIALVCLQVAVWTAAAFYISELFPATIRWRATANELLFMSVVSKVFTVGSKTYSILNLLELLLILIGLWLLARGVAGLVKSHVLKATGANQTVQDLIAVILQSTLILLGLLIVLQTVGVDVSSLAIAASVIGIGIGFGLQNIANNFVSGIIIALEQPIKIGDFIKVGDLVGTVERIGFRSSEIITLDKISIIVPNSRFLENEVINWSHGDPVSRLRIPVGIAYGSNLKKVQKALLEAAKDHPDVLGFPAPQINFRGFGESALDFELYIWIREPPEQFRITSDLNYMIESSLRKHGLEIPFPQRDLHLRSPQLDEMMATWTKLHSPPETRLYHPGTGKSEKKELFPGPSPTESEEAPTVQAIRAIEGLNLEALVVEMRGPSGLEIKDRRHLINIYPKCFVGSEAVQWLMAHKRTTREGAIRIGQLLVDRGIIHHVLDEHSFEDKSLFYRFLADE